MSEKFEHYYTVEPTSKLKVREAKLVLKNGHEYIFKTPSGVYSYGKIDKATQVLLENLKVHGKKVLDLGCGYGVIGIVLKREYPDLEVYMSDINKRAVEFAKINAKNHNVEVDIRWGNLYEPWEGMKFDMIVSNPPIVAGKKVWMEIVKRAPEFLEEGGSLQIVAYHNKGGRRIRDFMKEVFGNVEELCKTGGIRVYRSVKGLKEDEDNAE
ncbi:MULTISPECIES: class I SAM-dependent methyltransferase [unclassified Thermotoga]|uniref:class I SAM-dependent methyltransferase n=1 Tax=unclassified Thermotoga TaxID=2631113 RepID=UPI000280E9BA|nr:MULTISPECIES: class I SAM-dependent methyltransferase [unclassified Thermotoga]AIY86698.1 methyltransferase small [Thermotoga sp. 2812B]EJX25416.1 methyltransferase small [Thermotoga sp. EMP]KAF2960590.1 SAM-dependent methyltransferase [Thermotoga sp. 38H-to]